METPRQDGGIGRYTLLPHTTKRKITTNLKTKYNQNCQKTELYGSLMNKELKKKDSFRLVGGEETGRQGGEDAWQGGGWRTRQVRLWLRGWNRQDSGWWMGQSHICVQITGRNN